MEEDRRRRPPVFLARNYVTILSAAARIYRRDERPFSSAEVLREIFTLEEEIAAQAGERYSMGRLQIMPNTLYRGLHALNTEGLIDIRDNTGRLPARVNRLHQITESGIWRLPIEISNLSTRQRPPIPADFEVFKIMTGEADKTTTPAV